MNKPGNPPTPTHPVRQPVLLGLFTGTAIGAGFLLAGVPNVELMTLIVTLAGAALGSGLGFLCGVIASLAYSIGSPFGAPVPILLAGQVLGLGFAGFLGGAVAPFLIRAHSSGLRIHSIVLAGLTGLLATLVFDLLTNLAIIQAFDMTPLVVLGGAVPFFLIHAGFNTFMFALLLPALTVRLQGLNQAPLRGQGRVLLFLLVMGSAILPVTRASAQNFETQEEPTQVPDSQEPTMVAVIDSLETDHGLDGPYAAFGWRRPLWDPFAPTTLYWFNWNTNWVVMTDGGLGSATMILGEASTSINPAFERDGVPVGTGHVLADDPGLISNQGIRFNNYQMGLNQRTGGGGTVSMVTDDRAPGRALSVYRGVKGPHETYQRGFSLLTPRSAWRVAFEFDENLDKESYNFTDEPDEIFRSEVSYPGHSRIRMSRTRLIRNLDNDNSLALEYTTGRKTKDTLPAWGAKHQEIWDSGAAGTMKARLGEMQMRAVLYWDSRDVQWGDRGTTTGPNEDARLLETVRQGISVDLVSASAAPDTSNLPGAKPTFDWDQMQTTPRTSLGIRFADWKVEDTGIGWQVGQDLKSSGTGQTSQLFGQTGWDLGNLRLQGALAGAWDSFGGTALNGEVSVGSGIGGPFWKVALSRGGRGPSSDELLTPQQRNVNGQDLFILPNLDLGRENTWRLQALGGIRLLGFDLAIDGSVRKLDEGITWVPLSGSTDTGRWSNSLGLKSSRFTGSIGRQGRFLGWGRIKLEGTWQSFEETAGRAVLLPPDQYLRLVVMWENHFFKEDGIAQLALYGTHRGEMADPWDLTRSYRLPATTVYDLLVGFRLLGTNISLAIRNLTDQKVQLSAGAHSDGLELDLRLHWTFYY